MLPCVQFCEFEGLLFPNVEAFARILPAIPFAEHRWLGVGTGSGTGCVPRTAVALLETAPTHPTVPGPRGQSRGVPPTEGQPALAVHGDLS